jgi:hypothetical protein
MLTYQELRNNLDSAFEYRQRRHEDWKTNYMLLRDKVITNRLTQRQSVNVPLMKANLSTLQANIAPIADLDFESLDNDKQAQLFMNEYWAWTAKANSLGVIDHVDTKQQLLYGRSFIKLNIVNGKIKLTVEDPQDILVDRFTDPVDIETARYVIHGNIFKTLDEILEDPNYDGDAKSHLKSFYATKLGLIKAEENAELMRDRNERLAEMGVDDVNDPLLGATYVVLNEHIVKEWDKDAKDFKKQIYTTADTEILRHKSLKDALNIDLYPLVTWASDVEKTDFPAPFISYEDWTTPVSHWLRSLPEYRRRWKRTGCLTCGSPGSSHTLGHSSGDTRSSARRVGDTACWHGARTAYRFLSEGR